MREPAPYDPRMRTVNTLVLKDEKVMQDGQMVKTGRYILTPKTVRVLDFYEVRSVSTLAPSRAPARFAGIVSGTKG